jgi:hypothetical protein
MSQSSVGISETGICCRKSRVDRDRAFELLDPLLEARFRSLIPIIAALQVSPVRVWIFGDMAASQIGRFAGGRDSQLARKIAQEPPLQME